MKEYQFYGIMTAIWSCGIVGSSSISGGIVCSLLAVLNLGLLLISKD
jgi:hypothetical protein